MSFATNPFRSDAGSETPAAVPPAAQTQSDVVRIKIEQYNKEREERKKQREMRPRPIEEGFGLTRWERFKSNLHGPSKLRRRRWKIYTCVGTCITLILLIIVIWILIKIYVPF
eukprot:TRINITY_DN11145_c0_g1_i1.p1 TRINITY_DN11145_c0_g1~~TRINITY_DN11145_c0_g1_i1.p1  ORF type:complete len:113 (+),score=23.36 TRINITY_DN11145_c0_g1_i1:124-462(+)